MIEFILDIMTLVLGRKTWRTMSGPAVAVGALMFGLVGLLIAGSGGVGLVVAENTALRLAAGVALVLGFVLLWSVGRGVGAFLRAESKQP
jgi:hypothetical protein